MGKLTKRQIMLHERALQLLQRGNLTEDEKLFVYEHYREDAKHMNGKAGAFFTPLGLAKEIALHIPFIYDHSIRIVDLCAGIGVLSYAAQLESRDDCACEITCVEINPDYVEAGKRLLPEATWICGDIFDPKLSLGRFDFAIANPPCGVAPVDHRCFYRTNYYEYRVIEVASAIAKDGAFLIPQMSSPFLYSGTEQHTWLTSDRARKFQNQTGIKLEFNIGIDTTVYQKDWHFNVPTTEIVCCDFYSEDDLYPWR